ncbi:probable carboxylesterase 18 [Papaver somniferum]|uniref:probable carboxylesterase 18 n=1 Tax=Papaver somniferum TaxID=3469 RepID=UPI000E6F81A0|nr:probable carboxylesterase 18 [Papaver somniferum]
MFRQRTVSPVLPWMLRLSLSFVTFFYSASVRLNGTVNRSLVNTFEYFLKRPQNAKPVHGVKTLDILIDSTKELWYRLFIPTELPSADGGTNKLPVILFFHGGAFTFLSPDLIIYDAVCRRFAHKVPAIVVSVNYRLTPDHRFPSQYDDGFDTLKFLDENNFSGLPSNADLSCCFLAGDSAGGNIAHHVAVRWASKVDEFQQVKVIGLVAIQPFFGGEERTESETRLHGAPVIPSVKHCDRHWKMFVPEGSDRDHEAVNIFGPNSKTDISKLKEFPSTLVFIGGFDPLQDWQRRYYEGLMSFGKQAYLVEYHNVIHAFYVIPDFSESYLLISEVKRFIWNQISSNNTSQIYAKETQKNY